MTPARYRQVTLLALVALAAIIVTGAAVRLTDSGLGCPTWPSCESDSLTPRSATDAHAMVEFVNRVFTGAVSVAVALAVLGARRRRPRRADLERLAWGLVAGVAAQIVLGGLTVLFDLAPQLVMGHFLLSLVLVTTAVGLHDRAGRDDPTNRPAGVAPEVAALGRWLMVAATLVVVTGTMVTGAGPHGGDAEAERLPFAVRTVAQIHGTSVILFVTATLAAVWLARRTGAPPTVHGRLHALLAVEVAQAGVGYVQYFTGVPEVLVGVHVLGAVGVWIAAVLMVLSCGSRLELSAPARRPDRAGAQP